jgi:hypothetical protein
LQLSLKGSGNSSAGRRVVQPAADSSEDSEDDFDKETSENVDQGQQQSLDEENLRIDKELRNLRQEQADAAEKLLQQVSICVMSMLPLLRMFLRCAGSCSISCISAAEARNRFSSCATGPKARHHTRLGEVLPQSLFLQLAAH